MSDNTNSTDADENTTLTTTAADAPAPKRHGDLPRARPHLADPSADAVTQTTDGYVVAARGPYAGVARLDLAAPAALFHVVEYEQGRYVEARHRDPEIDDDLAERMADHFALFYDLDRPAAKPGTLVGIYEDLSEPHHGGGHITEAFGVIGPAAALDVPDSGDALEARDREHAERREAAQDADKFADLDAALERDPWSDEAREAWEQARADRREE